MAENQGDVGFEDGMSWLPSHVLHDTEVHLRYQRSQEHRHHFKNCAKTLPPVHQQSNFGLKPQNKQPRHPTNWGSGGPGMQAFFLDSGQRSCGTGVFLPPRAANDLQPSKKPACSPVLLPSRVVQALNLNVHELGLQISPRIEKKNNSNGGRKSFKNKDGKDVSTTDQFCIISQKRNSSTNIFLPKEWTY